MEIRDEAMTRNGVSSISDGAVSVLAHSIPSGYFNDVIGNTGFIVLTQQINLPFVSHLFAFNYSQLF